MNKRYGIRLWRNYIDPRFCPVLWLMTYLSYFTIATGAIFQQDTPDPETGNPTPTGENMVPTVWEKMTDAIFKAAGMYDPTKPAGERGCTNHSIRRSAAQWAGRCGAGELAVRNNGRWKTLEMLMLYIAQGRTSNSHAKEANEGGDPIEKIWVFKEVHVESFNGLDHM